jgi:hypothetical protein
LAPKGEMIDEKNSRTTKVVYLKASNLFLVLNNQLLKLLKLLASLILLLLALMLYSKRFLQNSALPNSSFKLFLVN